MKRAYLNDKRISFENWKFCRVSPSRPKRHCCLFGDVFFVYVQNECLFFGVWAIRCAASQRHWVVEKKNMLSHISISLSSWALIAHFLCRDLICFENHHFWQHGGHSRQRKKMHWIILDDVNDTKFGVSHPMKSACFVCTRFLMNKFLFWCLFVNFIYIEIYNINASVVKMLVYTDCRMIVIRHIAGSTYRLCITVQRKLHANIASGRLDGIPLHHAIFISFFLLHGVCYTTLC